MGQGQHLLSAGVIEGQPILLSLLFVLLSGVGQGTESLVPVRFQGVGNEPIVWFDLYEPVACLMALG